MKKSPELVVMLTHYDRTVENAYDVFDQCKNTKAKYWGFKEEPIPLRQMQELYSYMKEYGKITSLEVVAYTEEECVRGAKMAAACGCDYLLGTYFFDSVNEICQEKGIRYMPFVGKVSERPSILEGSISGMIEEAHRYLEKGVYGLDLLGYRYTQDAYELNRQFVAAVEVPVCIAGSINSYQRLDEIAQISPWSFTIGGAFFENKFQGSIPEQIDKVCDYLEKKNA